FFGKAIMKLIHVSKNSRYNSFIPSFQVLLILQNVLKLTVLPVQKLTSIMSSLLFWRKKKDISLCVL
ncbi:hypothetical protein HMPREF0083_03187, partial [Aneurinibacillus aneurinilyticus ATCC 12856]